MSFVSRSMPMHTLPLETIECSLSRTAGLAEESFSSPYNSEVRRLLHHFAPTTMTNSNSPPFAEQPKRVSTPLENTPAWPWNPEAPIAAPLCLHTPKVPPEWVDYNGHMSESCFLLAFGDSGDAFFRFLGIDERYRDERGLSFYTVETHLHNLSEASEGDPLRLTLQLLDADEKRMHTFHSMYHDHSGALLATGEQMLVHVNAREGRSTPMPSDIHAHVQAVLAAHRQLARPKQAGSSIGIRRK